MCLVGICSAAFHATLRQGAQFSDDLSMLLLAGGLLRRLYTYGQTPRVASLISAVVFLGTLVGTYANPVLCSVSTPRGGRSHIHTLYLNSAPSPVQPMNVFGRFTNKRISPVAPSTVSLIYVRSGAIIIHFTTFSVQCHLIWPRTLYLIHRHGQRDGPGGAQHSSSSRGDKSPSRARPTASLQRRFWRAAGILVLAFAVWNVDLEGCAALRSARDALGLPWAWLLELHGWWHILTAVGAMEYVALVRTLCEEGE